MQPPGNIVTSHTPPFNVVRKYFVMATLAFVFLNGLMLFGSSYVYGHHFQPEPLTFVHLAILGWATLIVMGTMTQLVPVILETTLFSNWIAKIVFWLYLLGITGIAGHFWSFAITGWGMISAGAITFIAIILFILNIGLTLFKVKKIDITVAHIIAALIYLFSVALMGLILATNLGFPFIKGNHLRYLALHASLGFAGWFSMIIMGVSYRLIPMFILSYNYSKKPGWLAFWLTNAGIIGITFEFFTGRPFYSSILIGTGLFMCSYQIFLIVEGRMKKTLDIGLKHAMIAYGYIPVAALLGIYVALGHGLPEMKERFILTFGFTVIFGCISLIIIGMMYKIVPFLVWFHKYSDKVGKEKIPMLKDMFSERIGTIQFWFINTGLPIVMGGLLMGNQAIIAVGLTLMFIASLLFGYNILTIFTRK